MKTIIWVIILVIAIGALWYLYSIGSFTSPSELPVNDNPEISDDSSVITEGDTTADIEQDLNVQIPGDLDADLNQLDEEVKGF